MKYCEDLTDRQAKVLDYIRQYTAKFGYAPSIRCIGDRFDMQTNGVVSHLRALERKGRIRRTKGVARSIVVVEESSSQ